MCDPDLTSNCERFCVRQKVAGVEQSRCICRNATAGWVIITSLSHLRRCLRTKVGNIVTTFFVFWVWSLWDGIFLLYKMLPIKGCPKAGQRSVQASTGLKSKQSEVFFFHYFYLQLCFCILINLSIFFYFLYYFYFRCFIIFIIYYFSALGGWVVCKECQIPLSLPLFVKIWWSFLSSFPFVYSVLIAMGGEKIQQISIYK